MQRGQVQIVKRINFTNISNDLDQLKHTVNLLPKPNIFTSPATSAIRSELLNDTLSLYEDLFRLYDLVGIPRRSTRGLIDAVGEGFKFLFGSMSNSDAKEIQQTLTAFTNNERSLASHDKTIIHLIDELNEANKVLRANQEKEKKQINKNTEILNSISITLSNNQLEHTLLNAQTSISRLINSIRSEISLLHYAILFLKNGILTLL